MIKVNFKKLNDDAIKPTYGTEFAAGADLYACEETDVTIAAGETKLIHTGIALEIPEGYVGLIFARSGLATKRGLAPANKVGVIDSDYRIDLSLPAGFAHACQSVGIRSQPSESVALPDQTGAHPRPLF